MPGREVSDAMLNLDAYDRACLDVIAAHGWMVQGVLPRVGDPDVPFAYTVGLTVAGLPELVVSGMPVGLAHEILNVAARRSTVTEFRPGQVVEDIAPFRVRVVNAPGAEVNMARYLFSRAAVRALQLVWPDKGGAFPGDPGWSLSGAQPVYT